MPKFYITTPIYYVNDKPHIGSAYTTILADVLARWHRLQGDEVFFLTGTDEHGSKVEESARLVAISPLDFATHNAERFKQAWEALNIQYDEFIRTSDPRHEIEVQNFLMKLRGAKTPLGNDALYEGIYEGLYCIGCERYYTEDELVNERCSLHPNREITRQSEKNYFFRLHDYQDALLKKINSGEYTIIPEGRRNEVVGKLKQGLDDLSISRESVEWGIRVPWDKSQTIYVWIDALINYYSATQFFEGKKNFWPADVHLLAKDILWFHAVIWEAILMTVGLPLPKTVATHGFFTINGQKMSKSLGNVIDPNDLIAEFGADATRYLILSQVPFASDGDISLTRFRERYQSDLANNLGNTVSRLTDMIEKYGINKPEHKLTSASASFLLHEELDSFNFNGALAVLQGKITGISQTIESNRPWEMFKQGRNDEVKVLLGNLWQELLTVAYAFMPFMPNTSKIIIDSLLEEKIVKAQPLFPRLG